MVSAWLEQRFVMLAGVCDGMGALALLGAIIERPTSIFVVRCHVRF